MTLTGLFSFLFTEEPIDNLFCGFTDDAPQDPERNNPGFDNLWGCCRVAAGTSCLDG